MAGAEGWVVKLGADFEAGFGESAVGDKGETSLTVCGREGTAS